MKPAALLPLSLLLLGCVDLRSQLEDDRVELRRDLARRTGAASETSPRFDGAVVPQARELLAEPLTEERAIKIAVLNNREVQAAFARLGVASAELVQSGLLRNPVFTANAKLFDSGTEIEVGIVQSDAYRKPSDAPPQWPHLTMTMSPDQIGQQIGRMLVAQATNPSAEPEHLVIPVQLREPAV